MASPLSSWYLALCAGCSCIALAFAHATENDLSFFFTSDTLYLPSLYRDLFRDGGSLAGWFLNPAPNFFPDMGLYFLLNAMLGSFVLASYAFPMVQFVIMAALLRAIGGRTGMLDDRSATLGTLFMVLIVLAGLGGDFPFAFHLLVNSFHMGALVNALLCTLLVLRLVERFSPARAVIFVLTVLVAAVSDKLFWITFVAPTVVASVVSFVRARHHRWLWTGGITLGAAAFSVPLLEMYKDAGVGMIEPPYAYMAFDRLALSWDRFSEVMQHLLTANLFTAVLVGAAALTMVLTMGSGVLAVARDRFSGPTQTAIGRSWARCALAVFFPAVFIAPVLNGSFDAADSLRYDFAVFPMALFVAGAWIAHKVRALTGTILTGVSAAVILSGLGGTAFADGAMERVWRYRPAIARDVDALADQLPTRNGVSGYWEAKVITMFSERGLVVLPTFPDLHGYAHVNRVGMFHRSMVPPEDPRMFSFIVLNGEAERERYVLDRWPEHVLLEDGPVRVLVVPAFTYADNIWKPEER